MTINLYQVGGVVRDDLLGIRSKDIDFAVEITDVRWTDRPYREDFKRNVEQAFNMMRGFLQDNKFEIFVESPQYGCIRARFPRINGKSPAMTADFVLCRKDGPSSDGRRPDYVEVGTLQDDLARRDFTVNSLARPLDLTTMEVVPGASNIIDLFGGVWDLSIKRLRFVGDPMERLREDGLRALRAIRFMITKDFVLAQETREALCNPETATLLSGVSVERRREELDKCFRYDTLRTMEFLSHELPVETLEAIIEGHLKLRASLKH